MIRYIVSSFFGIFLAHGGAVAQTCIDTDPVGDGWGWNGNDSCRVDTTTPTNPTAPSTCVDTDPVGDGWGWNGNDSCPVDTTTPTNPIAPSTCVDTDPIGDGWGWNGNDSCRVDTTTPSYPTVPQSQQTGMAAELVGTWACYDGIMASQDGWIVNNSSYQLEGVPAWVAGCSQSDSVRRYPLTVSQCDIKWQATYVASSSGIAGQYEDGPSRLVLNDDLSGTMQKGLYRNLYDGTGDRYVEPVAITWDLNGYQFTLNSIPQHRIAFESWNGTQYFSYYSNDENRVTCKKE